MQLRSDQPRSPSLLVTCYPGLKLPYCRSPLFSSPTTGGSPSPSSNLFSSLISSRAEAKSVKSMKGGRKNLQRATEQHIASLEDGHSIMQVVSIRGSNLIEVMDAQGEKSLALFPAKFQKSMWIKRGSFIVVDESGKKNALESGSKVACIVSRVLYFEQVRELQKSPEWPDMFKNDIVGDRNKNLQAQNNRPEEDEFDLSDDDDLPPLEANTNRAKPLILQPDAESESDSDS